MESSSLELFRYVKENSLDCLQAALVQDCDVNVTDDNGKTPLMIAAAGERWASLDCLKILIQNGADLNRVDNHGRSAMSLIIINERAPVALMFEKLKLLLEAGADPNKGLYHSGVTLMEIAFEQGKIEILCLLLFCGADPHLWRFSAQAFHCLIRDGYDNIIRSMVINGALPGNSLAIWNPPGGNVLASPLRTALYYGKVGVARYFVANLFLTKLDLGDQSLVDSMRGHDDSSLNLRNSLGTRLFPLRILSFVNVAETMIDKDAPEIPEDLKTTRHWSKLCTNSWSDIQLCPDHHCDLRAWPLGNIKINNCCCADCHGRGLRIIKKCKCPYTHI